MPTPETMPVHCAYCSQPVTLEVIEWPIEVKGDEWECPHCRKRNHGPYPGKMVLATKGHDRTR